MDFHSGLIAIFLIIDVASVRSTDVSSKRISNQVYERSGITVNFYFQSATNQTQTNYFLPLSYDNDNIFFSNDDYNPPLNNYRNFFLTPKTDSKNTEFFDSLRPVMQTSCTPYRPSASNTPISIFNTSAADNNFTTSRTATPPKFHPPPSHSSSKKSSPLNPAERISQHKCKEYTEEIMDTVYRYGINVIMGKPEVLETCRKFIVSFLVKGIEVIEEGEFTHMVALGTQTTTDFFLMCGGTLISHSWVLTAAHCTHGPSGGPTVARIGFRNLMVHTNFGTTVLVKDVISHPDYNPPALYADIALVQLTDAVTFNSAIRPACLYHQYDIVPKNISVWVSGWGITEYADPNNRLQKTLLDLIDNASCAKRHNSSIEVPYGVTSNMICAGDIRNNWSTNTCKGDSGGPLQIKHTESKCLYNVIGITSFGHSCGIRIDIPGVYTRVSEYLSWIESIVWPQK